MSKAAKTTPASETESLGRRGPESTVAPAGAKTGIIDPPPAPEEEELQDYIPAGHVAMLSSRGVLTPVREAHLGQAVSQGYRTLTADERTEYLKREKYGTIGQQAKTVVEGGLKGLTLGLSTPAEVALGIAKPEDIKGREEENPLLYGASEIGGAILPEFLPGVGEVMLPKLASQVARFAGEAAAGGKGATTLGRIGVKAASGALEGSLFGIGNTISEASLGDVNLNAEKIIANVGLGAVMGAGGGAIGGLFEEAAGPALHKMAQSMNDVEGALHGVSNEMTLKAAGFIQSDLNKLTMAERREVGAMLRERGHLAGTASETLETVQKDLGETAKKVGRELGVPEVESGALHGGLKGGKEGEGVEAYRAALDTHGSAQGKILGDADAGGAVFDHDSAGVHILDAANNGLNPTQQRLAKPYLESLVRDIENTRGFKAVNSIKSSLQHDINYKSDSGELLLVKKKLVRMLTDEIDTQLAPQIGGELAKKFLDSKKTYGLLATGLEALEKNGSRGTDALGAMVARAGIDTADTKTLRLLSLAEQGGIKGSTRAQGNRFFSLGDRLKGMVGAGVGSMVGGVPGAILGQQVGQMTERFARTRGPAFAALMTDWITKTPAALAIARHFGHSIGRVVTHLGEFGPIMASALASSPAEAMATHLMLSRENPKYREFAAAAGLAEQTQAEQGASLERAHGLEAMRLALKEQDRQTDNAINHVLRYEKPPKLGAAESTQDFGAKRMRRDTIDGHQRHVDDVQTLAANPSKMVEQIAAHTQTLGEHAPATTAALGATASRAIAYLSEHAAQPPKQGPLGPKWHPSPAEAASFTARLEVAQDPAAALEHAARGTLTPEHVETLKAVYPAYYQHLQASVLDRLTDGPKNVPYRARVMLSMLTGIDVDGSLSAAAVSRNQMAHAAPTSRPENSQAGEGRAKTPSQEGLGKLTVASRTQTASQGIEARKNS